MRTRRTGCDYPGCPNPHAAKGYCQNHYEKHKRGTLHPPVSPCCGAYGYTQQCAVCKQRLCPTCYGNWRALACQYCRTTAHNRTHTTHTTGGGASVRGVEHLASGFHAYEGGGRR